jgi:hypothetical protein
MFADTFEVEERPATPQAKVKTRKAQRRLPTPPTPAAATDLVWSKRVGEKLLSRYCVLTVCFLCF